MQSSNRDLRYYSWPIGIVCFFILLAIGNGWLLVTAFKGRPDRVVDNPYKSSLVYEQEIQKLKRANFFGLKAEINFASESEQLLLTLTSKGTPYQAKSAVVRAERADDASLDREIQLLPAGSLGTFSNVAQFPVSGMWLLDIKIETTEGPALIQQKLFIR